MRSPPRPIDCTLFVDAIAASGRSGRRAPPNCPRPRPSPRRPGSQSITNTSLIQVTTAARLASMAEIVLPAWVAPPSWPRAPVRAVARDACQQDRDADAARAARDEAVRPFNMSRAESTSPLLGACHPRSTPSSSGPSNLLALNWRLSATASARRATALRARGGQCRRPPPSGRAAGAGGHGGSSGERRHLQDVKCATSSWLEGEPRGGTPWAHKIIARSCTASTTRAPPAGDRRDEAPLRRAAARSTRRGLPPSRPTGRPPTRRARAARDLRRRRLRRPRRPAAPAASRRTSGFELLPAERSLGAAAARPHRRQAARGGDAARHQGRRASVLRNLKDVLASLHFYARGEGRLARAAHGPGTADRACTAEQARCSASRPRCVTRMAPREFERARLRPTGRVRSSCTSSSAARPAPRQVARLAAFLGRRRERGDAVAVAALAGFDAMKAEGGAGDAAAARAPSARRLATRARAPAADAAAFHARSTTANALAEPLRFFQAADVSPLAPRGRTRRRRHPRAGRRVRARGRPRRRGREGGCLSRRPRRLGDVRPIARTAAPAAPATRRAGSGVATMHRSPTQASPLPRQRQAHGRRGSDRAGEVPPLRRGLRLRARRRATPRARCSRLEDVIGLSRRGGSDERGQGSRGAARAIAVANSTRGPRA